MGKRSAVVKKVQGFLAVPGHDDLVGQMMPGQSRQNQFHIVGVVIHQQDPIQAGSHSLSYIRGLHKQK